MQKLNFAKQFLILLKRPGLWLIVALFILLTIPHYREAFQHPALLNQIMLQLNINRHAFERILFLIPIIVSGFILGWKGTLAVSLCALFCMLPRVFLLSSDFGDALFETISVFLVGIMVSVSFISLRREREHRIQLSVLDKIASAVSQSLELSQVLNASTESVIQVMNVDAALIFLYDEEAGVLRMSSHKGVSEQFAKRVDKLKFGEGVNGFVAASGVAEYIEDIQDDARLTKTEAVSFENLRSHFIVPLKSKNKVMGTLCIATKNKYMFTNEERETALAIGNEIGVAIDNARIYQKEKNIAEKLRISEEKYRNLFENAHDAIWLHDMGDNIIAANRACSRLTGYTVIELYLLRASELFAHESRELAHNIRSDLLQTRESGIIYEVKIIKKDGIEVQVQLSSSLLLAEGKPWAFQHIARDITEEKRMQENLHFYLQQVTQAQEEERKRIARELHDDTIQSMVVLARKIDDVMDNNSAPDSEKQNLMANLRQETNNIIAGVRRLSQDLRPPTLDKLGLIPALEWLANSVQEISGIAVAFNVEGNVRRLQTEVELILYRIIQEALRNVWKHSDASKAEVSVKYTPGSVKLMVTDNGKGLDFTCQPEDLTRYGKLGLAGIKERSRLLGGTMDIISEAGRGTAIVIEAPV